MLTNGGIWRDTAGEIIQAHGGGILHHGGKWYWYGENKGGETYRKGEIDRTDVIGISCYSSTDLVSWKHEGVVLPAVAGEEDHDLHPSRVVERPKVLHHRASGRFVMWVHIDTWDYRTGHAGVAVADSPTGPFQYLGSGRPLGHISHDMTAFTDERGVGWLVHSADWHSALHIVRLSEDLTEPAEVVGIEFVGARREAPAPFQHDGKWYMLTSGCTGWEPNAADLAVAPNPWGPWQSLGDPCRGGVDPELTWHYQSTFVVPGRTPGHFMALFDRWNPGNLGDSRYIWLPFQMNGADTVIEWQDSVDPSRV
ncbi:MAG: family 43 glycosylhydrolase [Candidatus Sumerlaeia bacterium]|nr:family 43 glycosylhydrolase [Candidatus Sumerlaeia bacterium]